MSGPTQVPNGSVFDAAYGTITLCGRTFQNNSATENNFPLIKESPVLQPRPDESSRFGLVPFRSPLLRQSRLLSFPRGTEMFQFPPFAAAAYGLSSG